MAPSLSKFQKVGVALALLCAINEKKQRNRRQSRQWMKRWLKERSILSHSNSIESLDFDDISNFLKMEKGTFHELLEMVRPYIEKKDTHMRSAVSAEKRLLVTLRYLATGRDYRDLTYSSIISHQLLSEIIPETCRAIYKVLKKTIKLPSTEDEWKKSAKCFEKWQFNNCVGCIDGRHILIQKPPNSGSLYFNYKRKFSVVLFAIVNANYEFIYVRTGMNGSISDGSVIEKTKFYEKLIKRELRLPESYLLPYTDIRVPYVFLADSAFALDTHIMKPFPEKNITFERKVFNYRLCKAKRVADNAFGILASRFRVFRQPINIKPHNVNAVVLACCALHNFLRKKSKNYLTPTCVDREDFENFTLIEGSWRQETEPLTPLQRNIQGCPNDAKQIRNTLTEYFNDVGSVTFQDEMALF